MIGVKASRLAATLRRSSAHNLGPVGDERGFIEQRRDAFEIDIAPSDILGEHARDQLAELAFESVRRPRGAAAEEAAALRFRRLAPRYGLDDDPAEGIDVLAAEPAIVDCARPLLRRGVTLGADTSGG